MPQGRLSEHQEAYIEFLCTPPDLRPYGGTTAGFAAEHGISDSLCAKWRRVNKTFRAELKARYKDLNTDPARIQDVVDAMQRMAAAGDVKAATLLLQLVGEYIPTEKKITEKQSLSEKSNEELLAEIEAEADRLRAELSMEASH